VIRVHLPGNLRALAGVDAEVKLEVAGAFTQRTILDALEAAYPALRGTIRDAATKRRRPMIRFFACGEDHSDDELDAPLPEAVAKGMEQFLIVGAIAGG
jgi:molybdopterin converting factor small subunit